MKGIHKKQIAVLALALSASMLPSPSYAENQFIAVSRYSTVRLGASAEQTQLLQSVVDIEIPTRVTAVGEALQYLLKPYGFELEAEYGRKDHHLDSSEQYLLLMLALPDPYRSLGPMSLLDALNTLGGEGFAVQINPITRTVSYQIKESYRHYISDAEIEAAKRQWLTRNDPHRHITKPTDTNHPIEDHKAHDEQEYPIVQTGLEELIVYGYGPVKSGETLGDIARHFDLNGMTLDQALVELFKANPGTFANDNMNHLKEGAYLSIPAFDPSNVLPAHEASQLVDKHYQTWLNGQVDP